MGELYRLDFSNGKSYIGITIKTATERFKGHRYNAKRSNKGVVYKAWNKYGEPKLNVLAILQNDDLYEAEKRAIKAFNTKYPNGYNFTDGGDIPPSLDKRVAEKIAIKLRGRKLPEEQKTRIAKASTGRKHSKESIEKMKKVQKGKIVSKEARKKMAKAKLGGILPIETRVKMSEAQRKRRLDEGCTPNRKRYRGPSL